MLEDTVFLLPNDILNAWSKLAFDKPKQFKKILNESDVVITVLKQKSYTQFNVEGTQVDTATESSKDSNQTGLIIKYGNSVPESRSSKNSSKMKKVFSRQSRSRASTKDESSAVDGCEKLDSRRRKLFGKRDSGSSQIDQSSGALSKETEIIADPDGSIQGHFVLCDGIKNRLRHPGLSPLLKLNLVKQSRRLSLNQNCLRRNNVVISNNQSSLQCKSDRCECHKLPLDDNCKGVTGVIDSGKMGDVTKELKNMTEEDVTINHDIDHEYLNKNSNFNDLISQIGNQMDPEGRNNYVKQESSADPEPMITSVTDNFGAYNSGDHFLFDSNGCSEPEVMSTDKYSKNGHNAEERQTKNLVVKTGQQKIKVKKELSKVKMFQAKADYNIEDSVLAELKEDYLGCMLCGHMFEKCANLSTHLYFCHKITGNAHQKVFASSELRQRKDALARLKEVSRDQMILSGKHCPICFIGMLNSKNLIHHMAVHSDHPQYEEHLNKLKYNMKLSEQYSRLSKMHINRKRTKCEEKLLVKNELREDGKEVTPGERSTNQRWITCCICDREFISGPQLRKHLNNLHLLSWVDYIALDMLTEEQKSERILYIKSKRKTRYDNTTGMRSVGYTHQIIDCAKCSESIVCEKYSEHLETKHPEMSNDVDELITEMNCVLSGSWQSDENKATIQCPYCEFSLKHTQAQRHMKLTHQHEADFSEVFGQLKLELKSLTSKIRNDERKKRVALKIRLLCRFCGAPFIDQSTRSFHENYSCAKNHKRKQKYCCNFCGRRGISEAWFKEHVKQHNPDGPNYICALCGNGYKNKSGLDSHKGREHRNVKRFSCTQCSKEFYLHSHYKSHLLKHSAKKAFLCHLCNKKFKSRASLKRHLKVIHSDRTKVYRKKNKMGIELLQKQGQTDEDKKSLQIEQELDTLQQSLERVDHADQALRSIQIQYDGTASGNLSTDSNLVPASVAEVTAPSAISTDVLDMTALHSNVQQVEEVHPVSGSCTAIRVIQSDMYQDCADIEMTEPPKAVTEMSETMSSDSSVLDSQYLENLPIQYVLDSSSLMSTGETSTGNMQIILEIYFDESGNVISNVPSVLQVEQVIDNGSRKT